MKTTKQLLGARIKQIRKARGLSQADFSERIGIAANYLSRIEVGAKFPSLDTLEKMSIALDVHIKEFFDSEHLNGDATDIDGLLSEATTEQRKLIYKLVRAIMK